MMLDSMEGLAGARKPVPTSVPTPPTYQDATSEGYRALWVTFAIMVLASIFFSYLSWKIPVSRRIYHVLTTIITLTAALSYFAMASNHGTTYHCTKATMHHKDRPNTHYDLCRAVFWPRYVEAAITTPLILLDLCLLAGVDGAHTLMAVAADLIMVFSGLFAALGRERTVQRWGWYTITCIAFLFVIWHVAVHGTRAVRERSDRVGKLFGSLIAYIFILWAIYPIVWAIAGGSHRASVDAEIIAYAVLDILAKPVFGFWLLMAYRQMPETNVDVGGYWSQGLGTEGAIRIGDEEGN